MRKLMLLLAAGSLWLFLAAIPVFADGGPHVAATNSGASTLTSDSCAGCHRAHTAKGEYLINQSSEEALCLGCHGTAVAGATTSVMDGVQYALGTDGLRNDATTLGALRAGGFDLAHIGDVGRIDTGTSYKTKVTVAAAGAPVNSAHIAMTENGLTNPHVAWGNGANNSGVGPSVTLGCTDCHNPHGNGQYRILNPVPAPVGVANPVAVDILKIDPDNDAIYTKVGHPFQVGDLVTIAGTSMNGNYVVWAITNGVSFQIQTTTAGIAAASALDITATGATGTVTRTSAPVWDSPLGTPNATTGVYPLKNYTVIQTAGTQATGAGFLFYASDITTSPTTGDYWRRQVPWNTSSGAQDGPNGRPATVAASNQVSFNQQMTAWCSACHTRYFAYQNPNPGGEQGSSTFYPRNIGSFSGATLTLTNANTNPAGGSALTSSGFTLGDVVTISSSTPAVTNGYVVWVAPVPSGATTFDIRVSATFGGAPVTFTAASGSIVRVTPAAASQWFFPRVTSAGVMDTVFSYQHSTRADRVCTTCHVAHGSNAEMTGPYSSTYTRPDGVASADSRLLKIDNRGTCQGCHDPTAVSGVSGWAFDLPGSGSYQGAPSGITNGTWNTATPPINTGGTPVVP